MNDLISREAVRDLMYHNQAPLTEYDLDDIPTVDAVPVVRCKDCVKGRFYKDGETRYCMHLKGLIRPKEDDFCSYGERKDGAK